MIVVVMAPIPDAKVCAASTPSKSATVSSATVFVGLP